MDNSATIMRAGFGLDRTEPTFFQIIALLREHPSLKREFLDKAQYSMSLPEPGALDPGMVPKELIELVAHELRWEEIRTYAEARVQRRFAGDKLLAIGDIAHSVMAAYDDDWDDRDFYERYRADDTRPG